MGSLDHAGLVGLDPAGAVTFVENHDTDRGGVGGPIVRNKLLAYAYILTAEGYPCIFYRDYSTDKNCFGLKPALDPLIHIHEHLASGATQQRWKDGGVFAFERMGGKHLLVGLNRDSVPRTITVQTGFPANTALKDFANHAGTVHTHGDSRVTITIPSGHASQDGAGYVCYAPAVLTPISVRPRRETVQVFEGASDLDLKPAVENESIEVCRVYAAAKTKIQVHLSINIADWTAGSSVQLQVRDPGGVTLASSIFNKITNGVGSVSAAASSSGFHAISLLSSNMPQNNRAPGYKVSVRYTAPETLGA